MKQRIYSLLVDNTAGVLARLAGLFSRRGYNIDSLTVGTTADPRFSRMTVVTSGDDLTLDQIQKQLEKQVDVRTIKVLKNDASVMHGLLMIKIKTTKEQRQHVIEVVNVFRAKIVDISPTSIIVELTGNTNKLDAFTRMFEDFEILELARTGLTGLSRGADNIYYLE